MIACLLLSAGLSQRFGSPKALAKLNGETVVVYLQKFLLDAGLHEIIVVLGADAKDIKPCLLKHKYIRFVYNKDYNLGQTCSFKFGLRHIGPGSQGVLLLPIDYPWIQRETLQLLYRVFVKEKPAVLIPTFHGQKGHPPIFAAHLKTEFLKLDNALGINTLAHRHQKETLLLPVEDPGIITTFNTQEEFDTIKVERQRQRL